MSARSAPPTAAAWAWDIVTEQAGRIAAEEQGALIGSDPKYVHRMRVASRRLRSALRLLREPLVSFIDESLLAGFDADLRALASSLGDVRDQDVAQADLAMDAVHRPGDRPAIERLIVDWSLAVAPARGRLRDLIGGGLVERIATFASGAYGATDTGPSAARIAPRLIGRSLRKARRSYLDAEGDPIGLHGARVAFKRLRYIAEFATPFFGDRLLAVREIATAMQDALGSHHDDEIAIATLVHEIQRLAEIPDRAAECGALARAIGARRLRQQTSLESARSLWTRVPRAGTLRRQLEGTN
ncbi:MAG: CHAD domain-containing protein [Chloroflexi bacterium]|nr:CHAD domain-containing protein [Chloroflexota bacterium]